MSYIETFDEKYTQQQCFEIRLKGHLENRWSDWFDGLIITIEDGDTLLTGPVIDQATLHGLLKKVRNLGIPLVSVRPVEPESQTKLRRDQHVEKEQP